MKINFQNHSSAISKGSTMGSTKSVTSGTGLQVKGKVFITLFCSIFIVIGLLVTNFTFIKPFRLQQAAKSWVTADAVVLDSNVRTHRGDDSTTYSVYIAYKYTCNDQTYHGDRFRFTGGSSSGYGGKQAIVRKYPKGHKFKIYIDPDDVRSSVIQRDAGKALYLGLFPLIFTAVGFLFMIVIFKGTAKGHRSRYARSSRRGKGSVIDASSLETAFKPATGHFKRIMGIAMFALIWNGIISVFVVEVVKDWARGRHPIGMTLFMSIFVLVGIGAIVGVIFNILRAFNPTIKICSAACLLFPGAEEQVAFEISGNIAKLKSFTISLVGEEQATYRRGTDTVTDTNEFFNTTLYKADNFNISRRGEFMLSIPATAMHSFVSSNNKIIWKLKIRGDIPRWPDVAEEYTLNVNPKELC